MNFVAGVDEVGRGCLAGPVFVAGIVFPSARWKRGDDFLEGVEDSKKLSAEKRLQLSHLIHQEAQALSIQTSSVEVIDQINILRAVMVAADKVVSDLSEQLNQQGFSGGVELVLMDGPHIIPTVRRKQKAVISGDQISRSIAAASIVAKVARDQYMTELAETYEVYGFEKNKGYGTSVHMQALREFGPSDMHRKSFLKKLEFLKEGESAEQRVAAWASQNGFHVKSLRWRVGKMEIDVVAERKGELHFFEVRFRASETSIDMAFPAAKQLHFRRAVDYYLAQSKGAAKPHLHFVLVTPEEIHPYLDIFS